MRTLSGRQELGAQYTQRPSRANMDALVGTEPAREQTVERRRPDVVESAEDGDAEQWLTVQGPGPGRSSRVPPQFVHAVRAAAQDQDIVSRGRLEAKAATLFLP